MPHRCGEYETARLRSCGEGVGGLFSVGALGDASGDVTFDTAVK